MVSRVPIAGETLALLNLIRTNYTLVEVHVGEAAGGGGGKKALDIISRMESLRAMLGYFSVRQRLLISQLRS